MLYGFAEKKIINCKKCYVLILIFLENALRPVPNNIIDEVAELVLILIFLENALRLGLQMN